MKHTIDASGKKLGRVASEAARLLIGKDTLDFARNTLAGNEVLVQNASKLSISDKKLKQETLTRYSGYPGGLKQPTLEKVREDKGMKEVLKLAISGMLPKNKLRTLLLKKLTITE